MKIKFNCDQLNDQDIFGWGSVDQSDSDSAIAENSFLIRLKAGGVVVGQQRRVIPRPDTDKVAGQPDINKGFRMPVLAPAAVLKALAPEHMLSLNLSFAGSDIDLWKQPGRLVDLAQFRSLKLAESGGPLTIADLWFASERELRFRVENVRGAHGLTPPYTVKFFQPEFSPGLRLAQIGESAVSGDGIGFITQFLRNPLMPLLITVCAANGDVAAMDAIPFPGLCRGGLHHAELLELSGGAGYLGDLQVTGDALLREIWDAPPSSKGRHLSEIVIDRRRATGAERIFSADMLQWLMLAQGVGVTMAPQADDNVPSDASDLVLGEALASAGLTASSGKAQRSKGLCLTIPADAIPSLAAVVSRKLVTTGEAGSAVTTFLTANATTGEPQWFVSLPAIIPVLAKLQTGNAPAAYPVMTRIGGSKISRTPKNPVSSTAMAIRFVDDRFKADDARILPVAPDVENILEPGENHDAWPLVSVVVSVRNGGAMVRDLIASLAGQTLAPSIELVIVNNRSNPNALAAIRAAAADHFDGRFTIIDEDAPFNHSAQTNAGVAASKGPYVCLVHSDTILHDARTLACLVTMAGMEQVAVAGCMMLEPRPGSGKVEGVKFRSAGVFPDAVMIGGPAKIKFSEPDCGAVFGPSTYPVAAVGFPLACLRRVVWDELHGLDAQRVATDFNDIDFCLRAMAAGYINVCTTLVAAFHAGRATRGFSFDVLAPARMSPVALPDLLAKCTVLRRIG